MENSKKNLKILSYGILILCLLTLLSMVLELCFGEINSMELPEGSTEGTLLAAKIVLVVLTLLVLWPQIYIGVKGLKMVKNPDSSRAHIIWAKVLFVIAILGLISPISALFKGQAIAQNILDTVRMLAEVVIFFCYAKHATVLRK